jgi:protein SCO1/2
MAVQVTLRQQSRNSLSKLFLAAAFCLMAVLPVSAEEQTPVELQGVKVEERAGKPIDLDLEFINTRGYPEALRESFKDGKPVLLNLAYYTCPMLCNLVLNGQVEALRQIPWTPGDEFNIVTISINPNEMFDLAQKKRAMYLTSYDRPAPGWRFFADYKGNAKKLAEQLGDHYNWNEQTGQFAHAAVIFVLTPKGVISHYLYGIKFKSRDLRLALTEASEDRFAFSVDRFLLYCFHYDPKTHSYTLFATNFMRGGGVLCVLLMAFYLRRMFRADRQRQLGLQH